MAAKRKTATTKSKDDEVAARFKRLADHLQQARRNRKISVRKVAQMTNLPESTIRALENPRRSDLPGSNVLGLYKIYASALEVPASKVTRLAGEDEVTKPEFSLKKLPKLKSLVVFSNIGITASVIVILAAVLGYAAWQGVGLVSAPELSVVTPERPYLVVDESVFEVRGSAERDASVLINGEPTTVNADSGEFQQIVFLQTGYNYITVEVINSFSTSTTETFVVIYQPAIQLGYNQN